MYVDMKKRNYINDIVIIWVPIIILESNEMVTYYKTTSDNIIQKAEM